MRRRRLWVQPPEGIMESPIMFGVASATFSPPTAPIRSGDKLGSCAGCCAWLGGWAAVEPGLGVVPGVGRFDPCDWGFGFELHDGKDPHWMAAASSAATFGHFGGAGTFFWVDPVAGLATVVLTDREWEVLELMSHGLTTFEIADRLFIEPVTVRTHVSAILKKLHVSSRKAALQLLQR